jgi:hypothetical protein
VLLLRAQVLQHVSQEDVIRAHVQQMARMRACPHALLLSVFVLLQR